MKIGIFGGTFNPIHYGHLRTAEEVHEMLNLDKTIFIPAGKTPFRKLNIASARDRYEMARIAIKMNPAFKASDIEINRQGISYSAETMQTLTDKYRKAEFFFILGIDAFIDLPLWREPEKLISLVNMVVISRPGFSFASLSASPYLKGIPKKTFKDIDGRDASLSSFKIYTGKKVFLLKTTGLDISATHIRRLVKSGMSIKYLLPHAVESYIISHKLYK